MNTSSRQILEAIRECQTRPEAELVVRIHGFDWRAYSDGTYVALRSDAAWQAILRDDCVSYFSAFGAQSCEYHQIESVLRSTQ